MFQIPGWAEAWQVRGPKSRLWRVTGSNKVAEERMDFVGLLSRNWLF